MATPPRIVRGTRCRRRMRQSAFSMAANPAFEGDHALGRRHRRGACRPGHSALFPSRDAVRVSATCGYKDNDDGSGSPSAWERNTRTNKATATI